MLLVEHPHSLYKLIMNSAEETPVILPNSNLPLPEYGEKEPFVKPAALLSGMFASIPSNSSLVSHRNTRPIDSQQEVFECRAQMEALKNDVAKVLEGLSAVRADLVKSKP